MEKQTRADRDGPVFAVQWPLDSTLHANGMPDVFISYARRDKDFVRRLHKALETAGRDTWVDWEDIPPTVEWEQEIFRAIEGAQAVVCVTSTGSTASPVCAREIEHAAKNHKRLIPVVIQEIDAVAVPKALAELQWMFFRQEDDFEAAVKNLLGAVDTDIEYVRAHTRLLTRGLEWQSRQRDSSLLLRGSDLKAGEAWMVQGAVKAPAPTAVHSEYIAAGRHAASRRQRALVGALVAGLVVTSLLAIAAWLQRREAITQRDEAVRQRRVVLGKQLAANSAVLLTESPSLLERSALLAVEAARRTPGPESDRSLRAVLAVLPTLMFEHRQTGVQVVAMSPDGQQAAAGDEKGAIRVWRVATGQAVAEFREGAAVRALVFSPDSARLIAGTANGVGINFLGESRRIAVPVSCRRLALSGDGRLLVTGADKGGVSVWDAVTGNRIREFHLDGNVDAVAFSPDGLQVAAGGADNTARVWEIAAGRELLRVRHQAGSASMPLHTGSRDGGVFAVAFHRTGKYLATGAQDHTARVWEIATSREVFRGYQGDSVYDIAFSPEGGQLASGGMDNTARVWDLSTGSEQHRFEHQYVVERVFWDTRGDLMTASGDGTARLWDTATGKELARMYEPDYVGSAEMTRDGKRALTGAWDGSVRVWNLAASGDSLRLPHQDNERAEFSPDGKLVATTGLKYIQVWEVPAGRLRWRFDQPNFGDRIAFSPDSRRLVTTCWDGGARIWDLGSGKAIAVLRHEGRVSSAAFSPDGKVLVTGGFNDGLVKVWDAASLEELRRFSHPGAVEAVRRVAPRGGVRDLRFSPDGNTVATAGQDGTVRWWNVTDGRELLRLAHGSFIDDIRFTRDGRRIVTKSEVDAAVWSLPSGAKLVGIKCDPEASESLLAISPDGRFVLFGNQQEKSVQVRSMADLKVVARLLHEDSVFSADFTRDGSRVLTASQDHTARIWDAATWHELARVMTGGIVNEAHFSPDERFFLAASSDGFAHVWFYNMADLVDAVCRRISRNLTADEWRQYLGTEMYAQSCEVKRSP